MESLPAPKNNALIRPNFGGESTEIVQEGKRFDFWGMVQRRKWIIFIFTVLGVGLGYFYHVNANPVYESSSIMLIEPRNHVKINISNSSGLEGTDLNVLRHDKIIPTETIINLCLSDYGLRENEYFEKRHHTEIVEEIIDNLEVVQSREEPFIFELTYQCDNQEVSKLVLNRLADCYEDYLSNRTVSDKEDIIDRVTDLQVKYDKELSAIREKFKETALSLKNPKLDASEANEPILLLKRNLITQEEVKRALGRAEGEAARVATAMRQGEEAVKTMVWILRNNQDGIRVGNGETAFQIQQRERYAAQLAELQLAIQSSQSTMGENHPQMVQLKARARMLAEFLNTGLIEGGVDRITPAETLRNYLIGLNQQIDGHKRSLGSLRVEHDSLMDEVNAIQEVQFTLNHYREEMDMLGDLARTVKTAMIEYRDANADSLEGFTVGILDKAEEGQMVWPHLPTILAIAGVIGLTFGFGLSYLVDLADKTFHSPEEITSQLGIPLIGHIPVIDSSKRMQIENSFIDPVICTLHRPKSRNSEAFRAIRTAIYFNTGKQNTVIQVTSPTPGDGKSTVAANLAVSIAQSGKRVLLVDADMRRPTVHHSFGIKSDIGFATVLQGESTWQDVIYECEEIPGLSLLPSGKKPANPAELVTTPAVKELIDELRKEYDFVILDTPPVLAVTDPCPIAARVDGVILTLRIKKNIKISADRATEILQGLGANIIGVVVNGVGANTGYGSQYSYGAYRSGYAYNGYGYGYGYGAGKYYEDENASPVPAAARIGSSEFGGDQNGDDQSNERQDI